MSNSKPTICICASASFYRQVANIQDDLEGHGFSVLVPLTAERMKKSGNFDVSQVKTWLHNSEDYHKKTELIRHHFDKVALADAILVLNYEKHGQKNYIGGNVLMEMAVAFHLQRPIFVLNEAPSESPFLEEIMGLQPTFLDGKLQALYKMSLTRAV